MKLFFIILSIIIGVSIGTLFFKKKITPIIFSVIAIASMTVTIFLTFLPSLDVTNNNAFFTLPSITNYGNLIRIFNFHIPLAWISVLAYLISMFYSIFYLRTRNLTFDIKASASAAIGTLFCLLTTLTGMFWAKASWGAYWNWDPRETSIFILLLIYSAYFALRSALDDIQVKARLSSVYSIIAFFSVPFLVFILPRTSSGLHPGSSGEINQNIGPVIDSNNSMINDTLLLSLSLSFLSFTLLFFWIFKIYSSYKIIKQNLELLNNKE